MYIFGHFVDRPHLHLSIHITHHLYSLGTWVSTLNRTNHTIYIKCTCHEQQATTYTLPSKSCNSLSHLPCTTYLPFAIQKLRFGLCFFFLTPLFSTSFSQQNTNSFLWINRTKKKMVEKSSTSNVSLPVFLALLLTSFSFFSCFF